MYCEYLTPRQPFPFKMSCSDTCSHPNQLKLLSVMVTIHSLLSAVTTSILTFFYCCSSTVVCLSPHSSPPSQPPYLPSLFPTTPHYCPCVLYNCSCKPFPLSPYNPLPSPLWSLSAWSQCQCLWLYVACLLFFQVTFTQLTH